MAVGTPQVTLVGKDVFELALKNACDWFTLPKWGDPRLRYGRGPEPSRLHSQGKGFALRGNVQ